MKKTLLIIALVLTGAMTALAQPPSPQPVEEPGSMGQLPAFPTIAPAQENVVPALLIDNIGYSVSAGNSYRWCATLTYGHYADATETAEAYYALLKKNSNGGWSRIATLASNSVAYEVDDPGTYKMQYLKGEFQGKYTNEVEVSFPSSGNCISKYTSWWRSDYDEYGLVGNDIVGTINVFVTNYDYATGKTNDLSMEDGYYKYQWLRKNPNTGEQTPIQGATMLHYVPTIDDIGYVLILQVSGDGTHCNFVANFPISMVKFPVKAGLAYIGNDGFILNTEYALDVNDLYMNMENAYYEEGEGPVGTLEISQLKAGQYKFKGDSSIFDLGVVENLNPGVFICFVYNFFEDWDGDGEEEEINWFRECQIMIDRYYMPLGIKAEVAGAPVATTVEAWGPDIDGNIVFKGAAVTDPESEEDIYIDELMTVGSGYYLKAMAVDGTLDTYYPSAPIWSEGYTVFPEMDEDWNYAVYTIDMLPTPPPLTGNGVIEGVVTATMQAESMFMRGYDSFNVLLKEKDGGVVATQQTDASGSYRFENVPMGSYEVLVSVDGCLMEEPIVVTLTAAEPVASGIDYEIVDDVIIPAGSSTMPTRINTLQTTATAKWFSTDGRQGKVHGLNIVRMTDGTVRKVVVK